MYRRIANLRRLARAQIHRREMAIAHVAALDGASRSLADEWNGLESQIERDILSGMGCNALAARRARTIATRAISVEAELRAATTLARQAVWRAAAIERLLQRLSREEHRVENRRELTSIIEAHVARATQAPDKDFD